MDNVTFFKSIIDTLREPLLVLDKELKVILANRAFLRAFGVEASHVESELIFNLGNGQWNLPELRTLLLEIIPRDEVFENFSITQNFPRIGIRTMLLNARKLYQPGNRTEMLLLAFEDVTERNKMVDRLQMSITETHHQVKNSLNVVLMMLSMYIRKKEFIPVVEIKKAIEHIKGYANLHEMLTIQTKRTEKDSVLEVKPLLEELVRVLQIGFGGNKIVSEIEAIRLSSRRCSSLAVVTNELVTNSIKQGATRIDVELRRSGNIAHFSIRDNGKGFPSDFKRRLNERTGFNLMQELCSTDFGAPLKFENLFSGGACVSVEFEVAVEPFQSTT